MRKCCLFLAAVFLLCAWPLAAAEESITRISSREELEQVRLNPAGKYVLTADIDFQGESWKPVLLSGTFDGGGHTISNIRFEADTEFLETTVDGNKKTYDTVCTGFFGALEGAAVSNLNLENVTADLKLEGNVFLGGLAGWMDESTVENCSVKGEFKLLSKGQIAGVSGLVGYGNGTITGCSTDVILTVGDAAEDISTEQFLGGILACGHADINGCTVRLDALSAVWGYCHDGGIVGMFAVLKKGAFRRYRVADSSVEGKIRFFEKGPSRRAYCKPFIGEQLHEKVSVSRNKKIFEKEELKEYPELEIQ